MKRRLLIWLGGLLMAVSSFAARADFIDWASSLGPLGMSRGDSTIGHSPGWYGGSFPGSFPVALTPGQAAAAALGAPDTRFVSLPGNEAASPTPAGTGFRWAFIDLAFSGSFDASSDIHIRELGNTGESVHLFVWFADGGNLQLVRTRGASDDIIIDLSPYAALLAAHGGAFTHITLGGRDLLGGSAGFDLDAVGVTRVPEPQSLALFAIAGVALLIARRRRAGRR